MRRQKQEILPSIFLGPYHCVAKSQVLIINSLFNMTRWKMDENVLACKGWTGNFRCSIGFCLECNGVYLRRLFIFLGRKIVMPVCPLGMVAGFISSDWTMRMLAARKYFWNIQIVAEIEWLSRERASCVCVVASGCRSYVDHLFFASCRQLARLPTCTNCI